MKKLSCSFEVEIIGQNCIFRILSEDFSYVFRRCCGNFEFLVQDGDVFYPKVKKESKNTLIQTRTRWGKIWIFENFDFGAKKKILDERSKTSRDGLPWASGAPGTSLGVISSSSSSSSSSSLVKLEDVKTFYARAGASAFSAVRFPARWKRISSSNFVFGLFRSCREDNSAENKPWISIRAFDTAENEFPKV